MLRRQDNSGGTDNSLVTYYKVASASEPASYVFSFNRSNGAAAGMISLSGIDPANPIDLDASASQVSGLNFSTPSITTRYPDDMIVTAHAFASSATFTSPTGMAEAVDVASNAVPRADGQSIQLNYGVQTAAGATGVRTAVASNNADTGNTGDICTSGSC